MPADRTRTRTPESLAEWIGAHAARMPHRPAYHTPDETMTWAEYDARATGVAQLLVALGFAPGERVGVLLPDGPDVHVALVAGEKAGLVSMGIGPRAGFKEIEHLMRTSGAVGLISRARHQDRDVRQVFSELRDAGLALRHHLILENGTVEDGLCATARAGDLPDLASRGLGADDLFLLNSTSGTSGMPKVVTHDQRRWLAFHELAVRTGALDASDVFMSLVPAPYGFGIWTSHVSPTLLGAPTVVLPRFSAEVALEQIERRRPTVLAAVSTQFILLLESPDSRRRDLSSLRVLYTGGEAVPHQRAAEFEELTGSRVLQFYGSNETGAVSGTALTDPPERRLHTAGRVIPEMNIRLFDESGGDVTATGRGRPGCKGPTLSRGYWNDAAANAELIRPDGWMLLGDIAEIDADGYLRVVGRTDDFIIRGGKNISGPAVEQEVSTHPAVAIAAAVAMPDAVFGERVCVYVELRPGCSLTLKELVAHLTARNVSKEVLPERLEIARELPRGSGGKVAKQQLRDDIARRVAQEAH